jgi:hypothetical protein
LEPAASLLKEDDDDYCEIIEESSVPEIKTEDPKRIIERKNVLKYQMKSIQVN